jgi:hypothetical protein
LAGKASGGGVDPRGGGTLAARRGAPGPSALPKIASSRPDGLRSCRGCGRGRRVTPRGSGGEIGDVGGESDSPPSAAPAGVPLASRRRRRGRGVAPSVPPGVPLPLPLLGRTVAERASRSGGVSFERGRPRSSSSSDAAPEPAPEDPLEGIASARVSGERGGPSSTLAREPDTAAASADRRRGYPLGSERVSVTRGVCVWELTERRACG